MLQNMLEVNYLEDASDKLITVESQFKDKQHEELCCRLIAIKGQHAFKLTKMLSIFYQNEVCSIWETYNAHYMHLNEFLLITNQSLVPLEMEIRNTKRPLGIIHWEYISLLCCLAF